MINEEEGTRKDGKVDERKTKNIGLSFKGLVFLVLKATLDENESRAIVRRVLAKPEFQRFEILDFRMQASIQDSIETVMKSLRQLRPKVNLEYFDEEYVKTLFLESVIVENLLPRAIDWKNRYFDKLTEKERKHFIKKAKKDQGKIPQKEIQNLFQIYDYLRARREVWNKQIEFLKPIVSIFRKHGLG